MGACAAGSLNTRGYSQSIKSHQLPGHTHITHSGIINQNYFSIGQRAQQLLQIHHGLAISNCQLYDIDKRNYFLSLFIKSCTDGQKRNRHLDLVIALDVSGSMDGPLKYDYGKGEYPGPERSRIALAKRAIMMMYDKLQALDVFSLVIFHNTARTVIKSSFVKDLNKQQVRQLVQSKFESGGTTISAGFKQSLHNIGKFKQENALAQYQHRIVMLTDVNDNSVSGQQMLVRQISDSGISTTIIGVSTDFKSQTCEKLIKVKGFNYLCAVEESDLQTYLVDQFDFTFFPCVYDVNISVTSANIESIKVYGSVDHDITYLKEGNSFIVTKFSSGFPSALEINKSGAVQTKGGLILVKFIPEQKVQLPKLDISINVSYSDIKGKQFSKQYKIVKSIESQEYYQDQAIKKGVDLFYYTQTIKSLLKDMSQGSNVLSDSNKQFYLGKLTKLKEYCPKQKQEELQGLYEIVQQRK